MNANAEKWVAALRSGDYAQTKGVLHREREVNESHPAGYCCLGVACDLYQKEVGDLEIDPTNAWVNYDGRSSFLPNKVVNWLALRNDDGSYRITCNHEDDWDSLSTQNDNGVSFNMIADIIESKPEGLFNG